MRGAVLRVARPTDQLDRIVAFYVEGLGFQRLAEFENHAGFDGAILGHPQAPWHLEFTRHRGGAPVARAPTPDNLLVFYLPDRGDWHAAVNRLKAFGAESVGAYNPYWDRDGLTFEDPDGWRVVLQNLGWPL